MKPKNSDYTRAKITNIPINHNRFHMLNDNLTVSHFHCFSISSLKFTRQKKYDSTNCANQRGSSRHAFVVIIFFSCSTSSYVLRLFFFICARFLITGSMKTADLLNNWCMYEMIYMRAANKTKNLTEKCLENERFFLYFIHTRHSVNYMCECCITE